MICFNCGHSYEPAPASSEATAVGCSAEFCSPECEAQDTARLVEGNGIIENALLNNPQALHPLGIPIFPLNVGGPIAQTLASLKLKSTAVAPSPSSSSVAPSSSPSSISIESIKSNFEGVGEEDENDYN